MSASPMARQAVSTQAIPIKRVLVNDPSDMPAHYSQTPGGTMFSTTPGGTKIVYERNFLLTLRNSPISKTPPTFDIPESLVKGGSPKKHHNGQQQRKYNGAPPRNRRDSNGSGTAIMRRSSNAQTHDDEQFQLDL
ncbi:eukaryotic translation initiation factor 4E-binding protein [Anthonomus grandis grandis]|uniref:eukaryotic translation initiation factor 4E-binding protein n=1 Tax=Anthonomus grandis grandis TaxID=2921223 RepID=UPI002166BB83|nr:eukaryotic translation initiation factor 4E-binding protein [Anthonomus grandis grandis]